MWPWFIKPIQLLSHVMHFAVQYIEQCVEYEDTQAQITSKFGANRNYTQEVSRFSSCKLGFRIYLSSYQKKALPLPLLIKNIHRARQELGEFKLIQELNFSGHFQVYFNKCGDWFYNLLVSHTKIKKMSYFRCYSIEPLEVDDFLTVGKRSPLASVNMSQSAQQG